MSNYELSLEVEVLREMDSGVLANFWKLLDANNISIDDKTNPISILYD